MATYAIGDVQGCFETFSRLLRRMAFDRTRDRVWLVGDLVNRGPRSVEVLRWAVAHDDCVVAVLGNHDLHLLARADGRSGPKRRDTVEDVLEAPDRDALIDWLRKRPLLHREGGRLMVHAGLLPEWTVAEAEQRARRVEAALAGGKHPKKEEELARDLAVFTRLRLLDADGRPTEFEGPPDQAPAGCVPWFAAPRRKSVGTLVVFGHWSALGLYLKEDLIGLDTGCVWGRALTAIRFEDRQVFSEPAAEVS